MRRTGTRRWIGAAVVLGLLGAAPASADIRWPWEKPKKDDKKKERVEPTPTTSRTEREAAFRGDARDREMLPKLAKYYQEQLDLSDRAITATRNADVKRFAQRLNDDAERALGIINERARELKLELEPHVRADLADKLRRQAGGRQGLGTRRPDRNWDADQDVAFLRDVMANVKDVRSDFADYKAQEQKGEFHDELARLFDDDLVPLHEDAKKLHDRIRNESR